MTGIHFTSGLVLVLGEVITSPSTPHLVDSNLRLRKDQ